MVASTMTMLRVGRRRCHFNKKIKPLAQSKGIEDECFFLPYKLANHLKIFTPVGTAIVIVAAVKYARVSTSIPTVNI